MRGGMRVVRLGFCASLLIGPASALADTLTYVNARFGTSITFPAELFSTQLEPPANGDGMTWLSADGASLSVYAMNDIDRISPQELADQLAEPDGRAGFEVTYRRVAGDWVVLSGYEDGNVFYTRLEFGAAGAIHAVLLKYPPALKRKYDPVTAAVAGSLSGP